MAAAAHRVGDLVWAKQQGFSVRAACEIRTALAHARARSDARCLCAQWWPCIVTYDPDHGLFTKTCTDKKSAAKSKKEVVHVQVRPLSSDPSVA